MAPLAADDLGWDCRCRICLKHHIESSSSMIKYFLEVIAAATGGLAVLVITMLASSCEPAFATEPPSAATAYKSMLTKEARTTWGLGAPVALFAAQIHQESGWRPDVSSRFADGMAQFTPSTAQWISGVYSEQLGTMDVFNPQWALRAMLLYDKRIYDSIDRTDGNCDRWAMVLSAYNGGPGWVKRDRKLTLLCGDDPNVWWGNVEKWSKRADWAMKENRDYPRKILLRWQFLYSKWGPGVYCRITKPL